MIVGLESQVVHISIFRLLDQGQKKLIGGFYDLLQAAYQVLLIIKEQLLIKWRLMNKELSLLMSPGQQITPYL